MFTFISLTVEKQWQNYLSESFICYHETLYATRILSTDVYLEDIYIYIIFIFKCLFYRISYNSILFTSLPLLLNSLRSSCVLHNLLSLWIFKIIVINIMHIFLHMQHTHRETIQKEREKKKAVSNCCCSCVYIVRSDRLVLHNLLGHHSQWILFLPLSEAILSDCDPSSGVKTWEIFLSTLVFKIMAIV